MDNINNDIPIENIHILYTFAGADLGGRAPGPGHPIST